MPRFPPGPRSTGIHPCRGGCPPRGAGRAHPPSHWLRRALLIVNLPACGRQSPARAWPCAGREPRPPRHRPALWAGVSSRCRNPARPAQRGTTLRPTCLKRRFAPRAVPRSSVWGKPETAGGGFEGPLWGGAAPPGPSTSPLAWADTARDMAQDCGSRLALTVAQGPRTPAGPAAKSAVPVQVPPGRRARPAAHPALPASQAPGGCWHVAITLEGLVSLPATARHEHQGPPGSHRHCPCRRLRAALWSHPWLWPFDLAASVLLRSTWLRCRRPTHRASPVSSGTRNWEQGQVRPGRGRGGRRPPGRANPEQAR